MNDELKESADRGPSTLSPERAAELTPGVVTIDGYLIGHALLSPEHWNGWACPYFDRPTAEALVRQVQAMIRRWGPADTDQLRFEDDRLIMWREDDDEQPDADDGILINGIVHYAIGAWGWTWYEVEPTPMQIDGEGPVWPVLYYDDEGHGLRLANVPREWVEAHPEELAGFTTNDGDDITAENLDAVEVAPGIIRLLGRFTTADEAEPRVVTCRQCGQEIHRDERGDWVADDGAEGCTFLAGLARFGHVQAI